MTNLRTRELHYKWRLTDSRSTSRSAVSAARRALAEAHRIDEVKSLRDKAQAVAAYARQAKDTQLIEHVTEIKVRAERRAGEMLATIPKLNGARGVGKKVASHDATPLSELGISRDQSSRWQQVASIPEKHFETAVQMAKRSAGEVTTAFMLREVLREKVAADGGLFGFDSCFAADPTGALTRYVVHV